MTHDLKTWHEFFGVIKDGRKSFELRKADRDFNVGDVLRLREWNRCKNCDGFGSVMLDEMNTSDCPDCLGSKGVYTGNELFREVTYILRGGRLGLPDTHCIMAIDKLNSNLK